MNEDINDLLGDVEIPTESNPSPLPTAKSNKELKGDLIAFKDSDGNIIVGKGVLYYVVRHNGRPVYKEASKVTILPSDDDLIK